MKFYTSHSAKLVYASFCTDIAAGLVLTFPITISILDLTFRFLVVIILLVIAINLKDK